MKGFEKFASTKVLVVGDVMLDRYWWGTVGRISPEAPVPVVRLNRTTLSAGGAGNVAVNIAGLGAKPMLLGIVGIDSEAEAVRNILGSSGVSPEYLIGVEGRPTTVKTRVIAHSQQVARIDQESEDELGADVGQAITERLRALIPQADAVVVSDYAKGLINEHVLGYLLTHARGMGKRVLVDPKGKDYQKYAGASLITPNRREAAEACNLSENMADIVTVAGNRLLRDLNVESVLITHGEEGMTLFRRQQKPNHFPTTAREVYDVTGAGDTVIATLATALGAGFDLEAATRTANAAAGLVVEQIGTSAIRLEEVVNAMDGRSEAVP